MRVYHGDGLVPGLFWKSLWRAFDLSDLGRPEWFRRRGGRYLGIRFIGTLRVASSPISDRKLLDEMLIRQRMIVRGIVQGVGFRPFVHRLAVQQGLRGYVRNHPEGVEIEVEGDAAALERFVHELITSPPPSAQIVDYERASCAPLGEGAFQILTSTTQDAASVPQQPWSARTIERGHVAADLARCEDCLAELFDPRARRYRYPFVTCAHCGPRFTIVRGLPFDRERTTMAEFPLCAACRAEYHNPDDRRFHAQALACPACGPQLVLRDAHGQELSTPDVVATVAEKLLQGAIVAIKGVGGYHLACDATQSRAVAELRRRKQRADRPFAVMVNDLAAAEELCVVSSAEATLLSSPQRPIVLLRRRPQSMISEAVAPGVDELGLFLPYAPLHDLLFEACAWRPLVMTSGNRSEEPMVCEDHEALERLHGIADYFLGHTRPIASRCDDSVLRVVDGQTQPIRLGRGYVPAPIPLRHACPCPLLAVGGQQRVTVAWGWDRTAVISQHLGDLESWPAVRAYEETIRHWEALYGVRPEAFVHDAHPDYLSTRYAQQRAADERKPALAVQHHHAHLASCWAEHRLSEPVLGVIFDGTGYGTDGAIWGGEFLVGDPQRYQRAGHFRYVGLAGGEAAIREPWRMALAHLLDAGEDPAWLAGVAPAPVLRGVQRMLEQRLQTPTTSSVGRLFDAVASLLGIRQRVSYEGQAAAECEVWARRCSEARPYAFELAGTAPVIVDTRLLIREVVDDLRSGTAREIIARRFHATLIEIIVEMCKLLSTQHGLKTVVCSGGVFMNRILATEGTARLQAEGFRVLTQQRVPPNDGGLSLGQLVIAAASWA